MKALAASLVLVLVAGCASIPPAKDGASARAVAVTQLANTRWTGVVEGGADARTLPRLEFTESRVSGFTGCNMLSGPWTVANGEARVGPLATTKRMCMGPEGAVEKRLLAAMRPDARVTRENGRLVFTAPDGARFEFEESAAS